MASKFVSERNLKFLLHEVFDVASLTQYEYYKEYDGKMLDMVLKAAMELAEGLLWPICQEMDKNPPELVGDHIKVHSSVKKLLEESGTGGWIGDDIPFEWGGQQLPQMITMGSRFIFCAANYSAAAYTGLDYRSRPSHSKLWKRGPEENLSSQDACRKVAGNHGPNRTRSWKFACRHYNDGRTHGSRLL